MSDDFGTVSVRGAERAREIEVLRQHYRRHRDALHRMVADAPTEMLAGEYRRLAQEIERAITKLDELEGPPEEGPAVAAPPASEPPAHRDPLRAAAEPGMRTLHPTPGAAPPHEYATLEDGGGGGRVLLILGAALVALVLIGWLIWRASDRGGPPDEADATVAETAPVIETEAPEPAPPPPVIAVMPPAQDYGVVRKGTRATRQYEIANQSEEPVTIQLARSACRCLYYDYDELIPPKAKISATVTVDGAKASAGLLQESIVIASRADPAVRGTLEVVARVE